MDSSFLQSQHPVVEELLTNKYFGDTLLVCANGHLTDNKVSGRPGPKYVSIRIRKDPFRNHGNDGEMVLNLMILWFRIWNFWLDPHPAQVREGKFLSFYIREHYI
jgi:hypothetical protein